MITAAPLHRDTTALLPIASPAVLGEPPGAAALLDAAPA